jgi:hypothetical protein
LKPYLEVTQTAIIAKSILAQTSENLYYEATSSSESVLGAKVHRVPPQSEQRRDVPKSLREKNLASVRLLQLRFGQRS